MAPTALPEILRRWQVRAAGRSRLEHERRVGAAQISSNENPRGVSHLYLDPESDMPPGPARPVCGFTPTDDAGKMGVQGGDSDCPDCSAYLYEVYLGQIG